MGMMKTVTEYCTNCETEVEMKWDTGTMGYKAFCPVCGERLMLCDECQHGGPNGEYTGGCDYDAETDTCRFNETEGKMSVFISQQMGGLSYDEIKEARQKATARIQLKYKKVRIIDSWLPLKDISGEDSPAFKTYTLAESLKKMSRADLVYFCKGWENGKGCVIEHKVCELYGIPFIEEDALDDTWV